MVIESFVKSHYLKDSSGRFPLLFSSLLHSAVFLALAIPASRVVKLPDHAIMIELVATIPATHEQKIIQRKVEERVIASPAEKSEIMLPEKIQRTVENNINPIQKNTAEKSSDAVISKPVFDADYLRNPPPKYPISAKRRGVEGSVLLNVIVNAEGLASEVSIKKSSGYSELDEAALNAVSNWRFVPAKTSSGSATTANVIVPVEFKLRAN